jgi:hypothetical protein
MTRSTVGWVGILVAALLTVPSPAPAQKAQDKEKASIWMKKKAEYAQKLLVDLTRGDFATLVTDAKEMQFLGYLEKNDRSDIPGYKRQLENFESSLEELIKTAEAKNLQGTTLAFQQLTVSCVQCHSVMRNPKK